MHVVAGRAGGGCGSGVFFRTKKKKKSSSAAEMETDAAALRSDQRVTKTNELRCFRRTTIIPAAAFGGGCVIASSGLSSRSSATDAASTVTTLTTTKKQASHCRRTAIAPSAAFGGAIGGAGTINTTTTTTTTTKKQASYCRRTTIALPPAAAAAASSSSSSYSDSENNNRSLFPAGKKQARVQLPALFLSVQSSDVATSLEAINGAVTGGATAIMLVESPGAGAAQLYEATIAVKDILRGRAALLIADRVDIANAAGADGVVLSSSGLPTIVAKGMLLQDSSAASLVGRGVVGGEEAVEAAADGANFIVLSCDGLQQPAPSREAILAASKGQRSGMSVPLLIELVATGSSFSSSSFHLSELLRDGTVSGAALALSDLIPVAEASLKGGGGTCHEDAARTLVNIFSRHLGETQTSGQQQPQILSQLLSVSREELVEAEKQLLTELLDFLQTATPGLEEVSLLQDALVQLDELFLLVVVGEFNSGKSAVINALLGSRVLAEGILPTTNEISVLKHAAGAAAERSEQTADGLFIRYIDADMLRDINIVDTPGTNVILDRQQRLTEEFVPRSDLVLFVMSADRPCTDSEVRFLRYIRQWGKKVVFVVNKVDMLAGEGQVEEVTRFVADNAARLLGVEGAKVVSVSAKLATEAKMGVGVGAGGGGVQALARDGRWRSSRFEGLESFVRDFLLQGDGESVRLKLQTPLFVAEALLQAAAKALENEAQVARKDAGSVRMVRSQIQAFKANMDKEGKVQREEVGKKLGLVAQRAAVVVDGFLTLSNWNTLLTTYVFSPSSSSTTSSSSSTGAASVSLVTALLRQEVPVKDSSQAMASLVKEHSAWVASNCRRQLENYREFAAERGRRLFASSLSGGSEGEGATVATPLDDDDDDDGGGGGGGGVDAKMENSKQQLQLPSAVATVETLLENNVRDAVMATASTAAGAGALGVVLTSVLPTTVEDLMALALSAAIGYASVLNLPLRRAETKQKVVAATEASAAAVQARMQEELSTALERCENEIMSFIGPLEEMTMENAENAERQVEAVRVLLGRVDALRGRVDNDFFFNTEQT